VNGKAVAAGEIEGFVKTVFDGKTGALIGAHMIGHEVTEMIQGFVTAITMEATEEDIHGIVYPHPTMSRGHARGRARRLRTAHLGTCPSPLAEKVARAAGLKNESAAPHHVRSRRWLLGDPSSDLAPRGSRKGRRKDIKAASAPARRRSIRPEPANTR
jgi:hypothetical protein